MFAQNLAQTPQQYSV